MNLLSIYKQKLALTLAVASTLVAINSWAATPLRVIATPNPNVFPMLLALANNPDLPVTIVPVATGADIVSKFKTNEGDMLLSMTYTAAQAVATGKIPDLKLVDVTFWRGFFILAPSESEITNFSQLKGKGLLISGPTSGGKGGGPDLILQAAIRHAGYNASDFNICYTSVMKAAPQLAHQSPLSSNIECDPFNDSPSFSSSMVEPAASGMIMNSNMIGMKGEKGIKLKKSIDMQKLFTGYQNAWAITELPHGGVSIKGYILKNKETLAQSKLVLEAYNNAVDQLSEARGSMMRMHYLASMISSGITKYYGQYGLSLPAPVIMSSLMSGDLVFRSNTTVASIQKPLDAFLTDVVQKKIPKSFYYVDKF